MYGYIYKTINLINNKQYIGQHASDTFDTNYLGSGKLLILMSLYAVTNKVSEVFCSVDEGFLNEIISGKDYPYELSFNEQSSNVLEWIVNSIERSKNL